MRVISFVFALATLLIKNDVNVIAHQMAVADDENYNDTNRDGDLIAAEGDPAIAHEMDFEKGYDSSTEIRTRLRGGLKDKITNKDLHEHDGGISLIQEEASASSVVEDDYDLPEPLLEEESRRHLRPKSSSSGSSGSGSKKTGSSGGSRSSRGSRSSGGNDSRSSRGTRSSGSGSRSSRGSRSSSSRRE